MSDPAPTPAGQPSSEDPTVQEKRLELAKEIFALFKVERTVHLALNAITFLVLIGAAIFVVYKKDADKGDLTLICGSGGLIGFTSSRLLTMWTDILNRVFGKQ